MNRRLRTDRSTETPMDFEFTSRPSSSSRPVWASPAQDPHTPKKRAFADLNPATPTLSAPSTPSWPTFSQHVNVPFLFNEQVPQTPHSPAWVPPPQPELKDVDMTESSPAGPSPNNKKAEKEDESERERSMAVGALRRVYNKRTGRERSRLRRRPATVEDESSGGESDEEDRYGPMTQKTTNHYTLNVAGPTAPQSDLSARLLGFVQFFFHGSMAAIGVYIAVQFMFAFQRDVETRVTEYSMEIVQEIAQCSTAYRTNLCEENRVPAMAAQCSAWKICMNRDPSQVGRTKVSFEVFGELVNTFVDQISWKTLAFAVCTLAFFTVFINSVISLFRSRHPAPIPPPHIPPYPIPPAIPYPAPHGYLPQQEWQSKPWKHTDSEENPSRRRRLEDGQAAKLK